jgi:hypothetical protein
MVKLWLVLASSAEALDVSRSFGKYLTKHLQK